MAKARKQKLKKPESTPSPGRRRLKVFKTPIGFHDAYVAAPSRKAALAAWGAGTDLFSAGIAEQVKGDDKATKAALASPGEVVRIAREAEKKERPSTRSGRTEVAAKPKPKPSRSAVDKAAAAVVALSNEQEAKRAELAKEEEALAKRRRAMDSKHGKAMARAEARRDAAEERYRKALGEWGG